MTEAAGTAGRGPARFETSAAELAAVLGTAGAPLLLDVREPDEFAAWAIPGAWNVPLSQLQFQLATLPRTGPVVVVCASGVRSAKATGLLRAAGVEATNLAGGMEAWSAVYDVAAAGAGTLDVVQVRRRGKGCLSYVVGGGGAALVVDPSTDISIYLQIAGERGWQLTGVVDTHLHADHLSGARLLAEAAGVPVTRGEGDAVHYAFEAVGEGCRLSLGAEALVVRMAPGHTAGSIVLEAPDGSLLTGDTLFVDGVGRPDLADRAEADAAALHRSLTRLLSGRDGATAVFPAHYSDGVPVVPGVPVSATLADVRHRVPQLGWDEARFVAWAAGRAVPRPPRYQEIVRVNTGERQLTLEEGRMLELGPNRCAAA